jgi:heme-degrading monooxygenase HmoA
MIARVWQARTADRQATRQYQHVFDGDVLGELQHTPGFHGALLLAHPGEAATRIRTLTLFESMDDVRRFAGRDSDREHVTPAARAALLDSDPVVRHFDVLTAFLQTTFSR